MKISDILLESYSAVDANWISKNCSEAIERYKQGHIIYRGSKPEFTEPTLMTPNRKRRTAAHASSNLHNDIINRSSMFKDYPKREIIMTTGLSKARNYGGVSVALPTNGAVVGIAPADDIFQSFEKLSEMGLGTGRPYYDSLGLFYRRVLAEFMEYVSQYRIGYESIFDIADARSIFKALNQKLDETEIEELFDALGENASFSKSFLETLNKCIVKGSALPLIALFEPVGFKVEKISEFVAPKNVECWTDAPTVLIPVDIMNSSMNGE